MRKIWCRLFGHRWESARPRWLVVREMSNGAIAVTVSAEPDPDAPPSPSISRYPRCLTCGRWDLSEFLP